MMNNCGECGESVVSTPPPCNTCDCNPGFCNEGCADYPPSNCIVYNGPNIGCLNIVKGTTPIYLSEVLQKITTAYCDFMQLGAMDKFARVSSADTTSDYLVNKLIQGTNIGIVKSVVDGKEVLTFSNTFVETSFVGANGKGITYTSGGVHGHSPIYDISIDPEGDGALSVGTNGLKLVLPAETEFIANNSSTINFTTSGSANHTLTASVKLSTAPNNAIQDNQGLYVAQFVPAPETELSTVNTTSITFGTSGAAKHTLTANVKISNAIGNQVSIDSEGLLVPAFVETDLFANSTPTIQISQSGTKGHTFSANAVISTAAGNQLSVNNGLYVSSTPQTPISTNDSTSIRFVVGGSDSHTISASVKLSGTANNILGVSGGGLYVSGDYYPLLGLKTQATIQESGWFKLDKTDVNNPFHGEGALGSGGSGLASFEGVANGWILMAQDGINTVTNQTFDMYGALRNPAGGFYSPARLYHSKNLIPGAGVAFTYKETTGEVIISAGGGAGLSGTNNRIAKFNSSTTIGDSLASDDGILFTIPEKVYISGDTGIGANNTSGSARLSVVAGANNSTAVTGDNTKDLNDNAASLGSRFAINITNSANFTQLSAYPTAGMYSNITFANTGTLTLKQGNPYAGLLGILVAGATGAVTNEGIASIASKSNITDSANYQHVAGLIIFPPDTVPYTGHSTYGGTITNHYGVWIKPSTGANLSGAQITNRYAIFQEGVSDKSLFFGPIETSNDIEITQNGRGPILRSPNGTRYRIRVSDTGTLTTQTM